MIITLYTAIPTWALAWPRRNAGMSDVPCEETDAARHSLTFSSRSMEAAALLDKSSFILDVAIISSLTDNSRVCLGYSCNDSFYSTICPNLNNIWKQLLKVFINMHYYGNNIQRLMPDLFTVIPFTMMHSCFSYKFILHPYIYTAWITTKFCCVLLLFE